MHVEVSSGPASTRPSKKLSASVKPAPDSRVRMPQCPSHLHPHHHALWQMCATNIFMLEGVDHLVVGNFYLKMIFVWHLPPGQSNANEVVCAAERDACQSMASPKSFALTMAHNMCKCPVYQLLYILGHNTWNLKSALPTIQWICWGMHQVCQTHTPISQVQWCWSIACLASTLSYAHWHQASIPSRAIVLALTQNNHSMAKICNNDPSSTQVHVSRSTHPLKLPNHRLTNVAKHLYHCMLVNQLQHMTPSEKSGFLLLWYMYPTMEQLSSMHHQWFHIPLHMWRHLH